MNSCDAIGYLASGLVFAAFAMKDIVRLRIVAICSNFAFLAYGLSIGLMPVWLLHAVLLPMNLWRLAELAGMNQHTMLIELLRQNLAGKVRPNRSRSLPQTMT
jgi:hypothetical protein